MTTPLERESVEDFIRRYVENAFGNHLVFGEIVSCEFDVGTAVWEVRFTTRELIWKNDYESVEQIARLDADGYLLELRRVGKTVTALDLYEEEVPAELADRIGRSDR